MVVSKELVLNILRCPDCGGSFELNLTCQRCFRKYFTGDNFFNLLPQDLDPEKLSENEIFSDGSRELAKIKDNAWRKLIGRLEIERFDKDIIPILPKGMFLELAGESCWASSLYKAINPDSFVIATDVSQNAIINLAIPLAHMFPYAPDLFAAVDAENLPFQDNTLDCIFIEAAMHHLPDLVTMLVEVKRVLKPGGRFVAVDHSVPRHFRFLFQRSARNRSQEYGIQEALLSYKDWAKSFQQAGLGTNSIHAYTNTQYLRNPYHAIAGKLISLFPETINFRLFPVGLFVIYDKD